MGGTWVWVYCALLGWDTYGGVRNFVVHGWWAGSLTSLIAVVLLLFPDYREALRLAYWRIRAALRLAVKVRVIIRDEWHEFERAKPFEEPALLRQHSEAVATEVGSRYMSASRLGGREGDFYGHAATLYYGNTAAAVAARFRMDESQFDFPQN